jgi:hypothetical protein
MLIFMMNDENIQYTRETRKKLKGEGAIGISSRVMSLLLIDLLTYMSHHFESSLNSSASTNASF